jgi:Ca2+-binding EF-hand superfamily protein
MKTEKNHLKSLLFLVGGLALIAAPGAFANNSSNESVDTATRFKNADTDHDGRVSQAEFSACYQQNDEKKLDANNDGMVSDEERAAAKPEKKHWWSRSSGSKIDPAAISQEFSKLDANHDGYLDPQEFAASSIAGS